MVIIVFDNERTHDLANHDRLYLTLLKRVELVPKVLRFHILKRLIFYSLIRIQNTLDAIIMEHTLVCGICTRGGTPRTPHVATHAITHVRCIISIQRNT